MIGDESTPKTLESDLRLGDVHGKPSRKLLQSENVRREVKRRGEKWGRQNSSRKGN